MELCTLLGALSWAFDITPKSKGQDIPYYEVNPYVITMGKPFPVDINVRSDAKRRYIQTLPLDAGYTLKDEKEGRWDQVHEKDGKIWTWEGLATPYETPAQPKIYPDGA